jgi:hypothetical protein
LKLIKSYTPDDCEDAISPNFIEKLGIKLSEIKSAVRTYFEILFSLFAQQIFLSL